MRRSALPIGILIAVLAGCGDDGGEGTVDATPVPDADTRGTISFSWTVSDGNDSVSCDAIGANAVSITMLPVGVLGSDTDIANCSNMTLTTGPVIAREYDVEINLRASEGDLIEEPIRINGVMVSPQQDTTLDPVEFIVDPVGNLSFQLAAMNAPGGNCDTVDNDGAEIVKLELSIEQADTCVPVDFAIFDDGGTELTPGYSTTCSSETYDECIPETYRLSVSDLGSGPTKLHITGYRAGDEPCYETTSQFDVPGNGLTADVGTIMLPLDLANPVCNPDAEQPDAGAGG